MPSRYILKYLSSKFPTMRDADARRTMWAIQMILVTGLSAGLGVTIWQISASDNALAGFQERFEKVKDIETRWGTELLSLQLGIAQSYDAVTKDANAVALGSKDLIDLAASNPSLTSLLPGVRDYQRTIERKIVLSEKVKDSYVMLRNSVAGLPAAIGESQQISESRVEGDDVSDRIAGLIAATVSFTVSPTELLENSVRQRMSEMRAAIPTLSGPLNETLHGLLAQVDIVLKERRRGSQLMVEVTSVPTDIPTSTIRGELQSLYVERTDRRRWLRDLALLVGILLVSASIILLASIRRRFAELREDNRLLRQANANVEEQLMQSARLSALGQMAAGITHEINTPLAYVKAVFELLRERLSTRWELTMPMGADPDCLEEIEEHRTELEALLQDGLYGLEEMTTLVRNMKNFARKDTGEVESFSIESAIESALQIASPRLGKEVSIQREFQPVPTIVGSPTQIRQAFVNLIVNATDAMAECPRPSVLTIRTKLISSDIIAIDICDNGPGIEEPDLANIFNPFFTTKAVGQGVGMGLSITYRIIENHGGTISMISQVGQGTMFTVSLPLPVKPPTQSTDTNNNE